MSEREFLLLLLDKVDHLIGEISLNEPLMEMAVMIHTRIAELDDRNTAD